MTSTRLLHPNHLMAMNNNKLFPLTIMPLFATDFVSDSIHEIALLLAAEEQGGVAAVHDGLRLLVVLRFELGHGLQDDGDADVAGTRDGDGLLNLRDGPDVRELVEDEVDGSRQLAAVVGERLAAELVDALPHHDGEQEGERLVGIR